MKTLIIAEAGVNHNGSLVIAKKLINEASKIGADVIKFQIYKTDELVTTYSKLAKYQITNINSQLSQYKMLKKYELSTNSLNKIIKYCKIKKIKFLASAFDIDSVKKLDNLNIDTFKIPSGEITNYNYLKYIGKLNKKIIISSGMSNIKEIKDAIDLLRSSGTKKINITVMHCTTDYPTKVKDVNLKAMLTIKEKLGVNIGYSDHTNSIEVPIAAVALGANIIEKHFTLNRRLKGPDHKASLEPKPFKEMIKNIRTTERLLGTNVKKITISEKSNIKAVRKSLVANKVINKGDIIKASDLTAKRPGNGINPMKINTIIGKIAKKKYLKNEQIKL
tara:strand:+ start:6654 stop:7655 length:1002 start_codon:yes stop_codon:yes gene_type:complete